MASSSVIHDFIRARNETHEQARRLLLQRSVSPDATLERDGQLAVQGDVAISGLIANDLRDPHHWVQLNGAVIAVSRWERRFEWEVRQGSEQPKVEQVHALLAPDGRIKSLVT